MYDRKAVDNIIGEVDDLVERRSFFFSSPISSIERCSADRFIIAVCSGRPPARAANGPPLSSLGEATSVEEEFPRALVGTRRYDRRERVLRRNGME